MPGLISLLSCRSLQSLQSLQSLIDIALILESSTYPTTYYDYPYTFNWTGVVPSTTNGHATCVTNNGTAELLPSHPPVPVASPLPTHPPVNDDGRGLNYFAETLYDNCYGWRFLQKLFPDVGAVSGCASNVSTCVGPVHALATAEFLTQTSTSHEAVDNLQTSSTSLFPNPLPIAAPATSTLLFSSAASTSVPARPSQTVTASSTTLGVNIANSPTETSKATNPVPVVAGDTQTGPFVSSTHISSLSVAVTASPSSTKLIAETTNPSIASSSVIAGPAPIVIGSNTVIANSASEYIISGATLLPGAAITIGTGTSATVIALQTSNSENQIVIGSSTSLLAKPPPTEPSNGLPPFTIGTQTITANTLSQYIIDGQTLAPGSPLTLGTGPSATTVALQTSNSQIQLIIGTSTSILVGPSTPLPTSILGPGPITIGTQTLTPNSASEYLIASQTLVPGGPAITVSGTPVSLAPGATAVVVGTRTSGLGNYIWSGIGGGGPTTTNPGPATYTGGAEAVTSRRVWVLVFGVFCGVVVLL